MFRAPGREGTVRKGMAMEQAGAPRKSSSRTAPWVCLAACGLTVLILMAVYALRGIWPFGTDNVAYVDTAQFYLPGYYKLWDALHGAQWNLNWFSGLAEGGSASWSDLLIPANWVFFFVPRDHILEGLSLYLAVYMVVIALVAGIVICLRFPHIRPVWQVCLILLYTFSGFVLQYYCNFGWLWIVAVFPLLLFSLERLLRDGKYLLYAVVYAYYLYYYVYYAYMATLYILLFSFAYCVFLLPKEQRGDRLFRLGLSTAAACGVTAYYWLGSSSSIVGTSRFQSNLDSGLISGFSTWNIPNTRHTFLMLLGMAFVAALLVTALRRQRILPPERQARRRQVIRFFGFILGMFLIPMVFTNIDTAWHFGQYNFFPMRYGYMLPATLIAAAGLVLEEEEASPMTAPAGEPVSHLVVRAAGIAALAAVLAVLVPRLDAYFTEYGACFLTALGAKGYWKYFALYVCCGLAYMGLYCLLFRLKNRRAATVLIAGALLLQLGANAYGLIAPSDDHVYTREYDPAYVEKSDSLYAYFSQRDVSPLARAKNVDNSLNAGYPAIAGVSALSTVASSNSSLRLGVFQELGYTVNYFRILDTGGTVFSDMLLGVQYILSAEPLDEALYAPGDTVDGIQVGTAKYPGRIGLMFEDGALDGYLDYLTLPDRLNALYGAFTGSTASLACTPACAMSAQGEGLRTYTLTCEVDRDSFLYMAADGMLLNITANGQAVTVPTYQNTQNTVYPATFNSNLLYMGQAEAGTAVIQFQSSSELSMEDITLVALDKGLLDTFYDDAYFDRDVSVETTDSSVTLTLTADREGMSLFLPLTYSSRWHCAVNGQAVTAEHVLGTLMSVPLQEGENVVTLTRGAYPRTVSAGLVISLVCLALAALWLLLRRFCPRISQITVPRGVYTATRWLFYAVCGAVFAFVYIAPTVCLLAGGSVVYF